MLPGNIVDVYRVEHKERREGPFVGWYLLSEEMHEAVQDIQSQDVKLLSPSYDFTINRDIPYCKKFACTSIEQLKLWFIEPLDPEFVGPTAFVQGLEEAGFVITHYHIPKHVVRISKSGKQVMYDCDDAQLVNQIPVTQLLQ